MTQQEFADKTQIGAATLSNIFNDRTRPSLNVVELIKKRRYPISRGSYRTHQNAPATVSAVEEDVIGFKRFDGLDAI